MKKVMFIFICAIVLAVCVFLERAYSYTFDGDFDPKNIFAYQIVEMTPLTPDTVLALLKNDTEPKFLIACLLNMRGNVIILAYAYYDAEFNFRHFAVKDGHYAEVLPDAETVKMLKKKLNALHGLGEAEVNDDKKNPQTAKETSPETEI